MVPRVLFSLFLHLSFMIIADILFKRQGVTFITLIISLIISLPTILRTFIDILIL